MDGDLLIPDSSRRLMTDDSGCIFISTPTHPVVTVVVLLPIDSDCIKPDGEDGALFCRMALSRIRPDL